MIRPFTLCILFVCFAFGFQASGQKTKLKPGDRQLAGFPSEITKKKTESSAKAAGSGFFLTEEEAIKFGFAGSPEEAEKHLQKHECGMYFIAKRDEKAAEIRKIQLQETEGTDPLEIVFGRLPKIKWNGDAGTSAEAYRELLENCFQTDPGLLPSLGEKFWDVYLNKEFFYEIVKTALDKGHIIK